MLSENSIKKMSTANIITRLATKLELDAELFTDTPKPTLINWLVALESGANPEEIIEAVYTPFDDPVQEDVADQVVEDEPEPEYTPEDLLIKAPTATGNYNKRLRKIFRRKVRKDANKGTGIWEQEGDDYMVTLLDGSKLRYGWEDFLASR